MPRSKKPNKHKSAKKHNGKKKGHSSSSTKGSGAGPSSTAEGASASGLRTQTTAQTPNSRLPQASSAAASGDHPSSSDPLQPHSLPSRDTLAVSNPAQMPSGSGDQDARHAFKPLPFSYPEDDQESAGDSCSCDAVIPLDEANAYFNALSNLEFTTVRNMPWVSAGIYLNRASKRYTPGECVKGYIEINAGRRMPHTSVSLLYRAMCHVETHLYQKYDPDDSLDDNFQESFHLQSNSKLLWPTTSKQAKYFEAGHHTFQFDLRLPETSPQSHDDEGGRLSIEYNLVLEISLTTSSIYSVPLMKFYVMPMRIMDISLQKPVVIETELPSADRSSLIKFEVEINKPVIESVNGSFRVVIKANEMLSTEGTHLKIFPVFIQRVSIPNRRLILQRVIVDFYRDAQYELLSTRRSCSLTYHFQVPNVLTSSIDLDECANRLRVLYLLMVHVWKQDAHTPTLLVKRDIEVVSPLNMGPIQVSCDQPATDDFTIQLEQSSSFARGEMASTTIVKQEADSTVENMEQAPEQVADDLELDTLRWSSEDKTKPVDKSPLDHASPSCSQSKGTSQDSSKEVGTCKIKSSGSRVGESDYSRLEPQSEIEESYSTPHKYTSLTAPILIESDQQTESGACQETCSFFFKQGHSSAMIKIELPERCETTKEDISFVFPSVSQIRLSARTERINERLDNEIRKSLYLAVDELAHTFVNTTSKKIPKDALKKVKRPEPEGLCQLHEGNNENCKKPAHEDRIVHRHVYSENMTCLEIEGKRSKGENVHICPLRKVSKKYGGQVEKSPICTDVSEENDTGSEGAVSHNVEPVQTETNPGQSKGGGLQRTGQTLKTSSEKMEHVSLAETLERSESNQGKHQEALQKDEVESGTQKDALSIVVVPPLLTGVGEQVMEPNECEKRINTGGACDDQNKVSKITRPCLPTDNVEDKSFVNDGNMQGSEYPKTAMKETIVWYKLVEIDESLSRGRMDVIQVGNVMKEEGSQISQMNIDEGKASQESLSSVEGPSIQSRGEIVRVGVQKRSLEDTETYESKRAFDGLVRQPSPNLMNTSVNVSLCTTALGDGRLDHEKSNISEEGEIKSTGRKQSTCISESSSEVSTPNKNIEMTPRGSGPEGDKSEIIDYETPSTQIETTDTDKNASTSVPIEMSSDSAVDLVNQRVSNDSGAVVTDIGLSARLQDSGASSQENQRDKENKTPSAAEALSNDIKKTKPKRARIADRFCKPNTIRRRRRSSSDKDPSNDPKSTGNTHSTAGKSTSTSTTANTYCGSQNSGQNTSQSGQGKVMSIGNHLKGKEVSSTKSNGRELKPVQYLILISDKTNVRYSLHSGPSIDKDIGKIASKPERGVRNEHVSSKCEGDAATFPKIDKLVLKGSSIADCNFPCDKNAIRNKQTMNSGQEHERESKEGSLKAGHELNSSTESITTSDDFTTGQQHSSRCGHSVGNINGKESKEEFKQDYEVKNDANFVTPEEHANQTNTIANFSLPQVNQNISNENIHSLHTYMPKIVSSELNPERYSQMEECDRRKIKKQFEGITYCNQTTIVSKLFSAPTENSSSLRFEKDDNLECCQMKDLFNNWRFDGHHDLGAFSISSVNLYSSDLPTGDKKCSKNKDHVNCLQHIDKGMHRDLFKANETFFDLQTRPDELRARTKSPAQGSSHRPVTPDYFDKCLAPQYEQLASEQKYEMKLLFEGATNDGKSNTEVQISKKHHLTKTSNTIVNGLSHLVNSHQHINGSHVSRTRTNVSKLPSNRFDIDVKEHLSTSAHRKSFPMHANRLKTQNTNHVREIPGELVASSRKDQTHRSNQCLQSDGTKANHEYFYGNHLPAQRSSDYDRHVYDQKYRIQSGDRSKTNAHLKYDGNGKMSMKNYVNARGNNVYANNPSTNTRDAERRRREQIDTDEYESLQTKKQCYTARINEINVELHTYQWRDDKYERLKMLQEEVKCIDKTLGEIGKRHSHIRGVTMAKKHQRIFPVISQNETLVPASRALDVQDKHDPKLNMIRRQKPQEVKYCQDSNRSGHKMFVELWTGIRRSRPGSSESISSIKACNGDKQRFHIKQPQQRRGLRIH